MVLNMVKLLPVLVIGLGLAACKPEQPPLDSGLAGYDPHMAETQRAACDAKGGRYGPGGKSGLVCYLTTRDGNQSCSKATDCEGLCLAPSRSCAPVQPLLGCNEILDEQGTRSTICID